MRKACKGAKQGHRRLPICGVWCAVTNSLLNIALQCG
jgi:hypothetical protein